MTRDAMRVGALLAAVACFDAMLAADAHAGAPPIKNTAASWSAAQATGPRDVLTGGDNVAAWATARADAGAEWLRLGYGAVMPVREIRIWQNDAPGAISRVTVMVDGREVEVWSGVDRLADGAKAPVEKVVTLAKPQLTDTVTVYLDTTRVSGWNEIDAVEVVAADGRRAWAVTATASSTYATSTPSHPLAQLVGQVVTVRVDGVSVNGVVVSVDGAWIILDEGNRRRWINPARVGFIEVEP